MATVEAWKNTALEILVAFDVPDLVLDLGGVTFLDSMGIGMLISVRNAAIAAGRELRVINTPARVQDVFELTGLSGVFAAAEPA